MGHFLSNVDCQAIVPPSHLGARGVGDEAAVGRHMVSVKKWEKQPPLAVVGFAFRMQDALPENSRLNWRNRPFSVIILIRDQDVFDVRWMIQQIHGGIRLPQKQFNDASHRELDDVTIRLAVQQKSEGVPSKLRRASPPTRDRRSRNRRRWSPLIRHG